MDAGRSFHHCGRRQEPLDAVAHEGWDLLNDRMTAARAQHASVHAKLAALGVAYGVAAEFRPGVTAGYGTAFGTAAAALLDEGAVPAVGLGAAPWTAPASTHAYALSSHLVFGAVTEFVRRQVSATLAPA